MSALIERGDQRAWREKIGIKIGIEPASPYYLIAGHIENKTWEPTIFQGGRYLPGISMAVNSPHTSIIHNDLSIQRLSSPEFGRLTEGWANPTGNIGGNRRKVIRA
jgi:hypothetical protein